MVRKLSPDARHNGIDMLKNWYSVPLWVSEISQPALEQLRDLQNQQNYQQNPQWRSHHLSHPDFDALPTTPTILESIVYNCKQYMTAVGNELATATVRTAWFTRTKPGEYAHVHKHVPLSDISGVVYTDCDPTQGDIFFPRPWRELDMTVWLKHMPDHFQESPTPGKIIIFPSWLEHGVRTNTSDADRYSYSFNATVEEPPCLEEAQ